MYGLNYEGLTKRKSYEELVEYLQFDQPKIKYPDRTASQIRNSPQLSNLLDGEGLDIKVMQDQQSDRLLMQQKDNIIKEIARRNNETAQHLRAHESRDAIDPDQFEIGGSTTSDGGADIIEEYDNLEEANEQVKKENRAKIANAVLGGLRATGQIAGVSASLLGKSAYYVTKGAYNVASGLYEGLNAPEEGEEETEAPATDAGTLASFGSGAGSSNDDLRGLNVSELRTLARRYDYKSEGVTSRQIKGEGEGGLRKDDLISLISKMRS